MKSHIILATALAASVSCFAADLVVKMYVAQPTGEGAYLGTVQITESPYGLVFQPDMKSLQPGVHGFHVHEKPSCAAAERDGKPVAGLGAGGHFDPQHAGQHGTPWGDGHLGDLPALFVLQDGSARVPVLAPRLKRADVLNRSLMIHAGGDNHSDHPQALGGGGARVACGVIPG